MANAGCMDSVCRVEGKAGVVLGENREFKEFQIQERALIVMGRREDGVNTLIRWLFAERHL